MLATKAKSINFIHIGVIVGIGLVLTLPIIIHGFFDAKDLPYHLKWSKQFAEQFWIGDFYPRWLLNMNAGLGSPTFFFYPPIPYYFTSLFHPLFANGLQGWYPLSLSASFALIASGFTAYLWLKDTTNRNTALIASLLYMVLPYHLAMNLYWRFAFAEYWALVWLPLILYFSRKIIDGPKLSIVGFAVSYALLVMTHLPTLVIFSAVPIGYVLSMAGRRQRKKALIRLAIALLLGIGLSAIYWLPAMTTQEYISMNVLMEKGLFYGNNFLFSDKARLYHSSKNSLLYLELLTVVTGGLVCCAFFITRNNPIRSIRRESTYWLIVALTALFMILPLSKPIWDLLPVVQRVQHPWRFHTVVLVATTALLAVAISSWKQASTSSNKKVLAIAVLLTASLLLSNGIVIKQRLKPKPNYDVDAVLKINMEDAAEYRPKWVPKELFKPDAVTQLSNKFSKALVTAGQGNLSIQQWKPRQIILQADAVTDIWLTFNQFYYPGWTARLLGKSGVLPVQPSQEGLLRVAIPEGKHEVIVTLDAGKEERSAQVISAVSAIVALFLSFWFFKLDRKGASYGLESVQPKFLDDVKIG